VRKKPVKKVGENAIDEIEKASHCSDGDDDWSQNQQALQKISQ
jgi:hypothetical protein